MTGPMSPTSARARTATEKVLDTLKAKGIKAGFFIQTGVSHRGASKVGRALVKRMHAEGHTVGVHTGGSKDHELHTKAEAAGRLESELTDAKSYVRDITGKDPQYVRPPTGAYDKPVSATYGRVGLTNMLWDIDGDAGANLDLATLKTRFTAGLAALAVTGFRTLPSRRHQRALSRHPKGTRGEPERGHRPHQGRHDKSPQRAGRRNVPRALTGRRRRPGGGIVTLSDVREPGLLSVVAPMLNEEDTARRLLRARARGVRRAAVGARRRRRRLERRDARDPRRAGGRATRA